MPFDPSQPFEVMGAAPDVAGFDPDQPFEVVTERFDPAQPFERVAEPPSLRAAPPRSFTSTALETVREFLSPMLGPTEQMRLRDSILWTDDHGNEVLAYKPLGDKVAQEGFAPALSHPAVELPRFKHDSDDSKLTAVGKAIGNTGLGFVEFFESPFGLATAGAGSLLNAPRAIAGAFATDLALKTPEAIEQTQRLVNDPATGFGHKAEAVVGTAAQAVLAGGLGARAAGLKLPAGNREVASLERELAVAEPTPEILPRAAELAKPAETVSPEAVAENPPATLPPEILQGKSEILAQVRKNMEEGGLVDTERKSTVESWADTTIAEGRQRLHTGVDPELLSAYAVKGAYIVARGVRDFAVWSAELVRQIPELARATEAQLRELFARSSDISDGRDPQIGLSIRGMKVRADQDLSEAVREGVIAEYAKMPTEQAVATARDLMIKLGGPENTAHALATDKLQGVPWSVQVKALGESLRMLSTLERHAEVAGDAVRMNQLAALQVDALNAPVNRATTPAQWLESFKSLYANYSPAAWLKDWRNSVGKVAADRIESVTGRKSGHDPSSQAEVIADTVADGVRKQAPKTAEVIDEAFGSRKKGKPRTLPEVVETVTGQKGDRAKRTAKKISEFYAREVAKFRRRHKIPELTPAEERSVLDRAKAIDRLPRESIQRRDASIRLLDDLRRRKGFEWHEWPISFWYANVLSGPTTHAKNIIGNAANLGMEAGLQVLQRPTSLPAILEGLGRSLASGRREAANILKTGRDTGARTGNKFDFQRSPLELVQNPVAAKVLLPWKLVGRALQAEDALFFNAAQEMRAAILARREAGGDTAAMRRAMGWTPEARAKAQAQAANEGLSGLDYQRRVNEIIEQSRPESVMKAAREFGYDATFNSDPFGVLGAMTRGVNSVFNYAPVIKPFILPFTRIVANVTNSALNWTPVGALRAARGQRRLRWLGRAETSGKLYGREITDPLAIQDAYARAIVGTAATIGLTAAALQNVFDDDPQFLITAGGPNDKNQRELLRASGWIPYSVKVGNRYYSYQDKTPQLMLAMIGHYVDAVRYKNLNREDALNRVTYALQGMSGVVVNSSWLQGLNSLFEQANVDSIRNPAKGSARQLIRTGSGFVVPAVLRQLDQVFDPTKYKADDIQAMLLREVPFARRNGQPDLNAFGEPINAPSSKIFFSKVDGDDLVKRLAGQRVFPGIPEQGDLTPEEHYDLIKFRGPLLRRDLLRHAREWAGKPRLIAQDAVNQISSKATREAKERLRLDDVNRQRRQVRKMTSD